jgi:hypothetical protein
LFRLTLIKSFQKEAFLITHHLNKECISSNLLSKEILILLIDYLTSEFAYTLGNVERNGQGIIRFYKQQGDFKVNIYDKLPGVGPIKLQKLKGLLLEEAKKALIENIESEIEKRKVYYTEFRPPRKAAD